MSSTTATIMIALAAIVLAVGDQWALFALLLLLSVEIEDWLKNRRW